MNKTEALIEYITKADAIERELAEATFSILGNAIAELNALQDRIDAGEFNV